MHWAYRREAVANIGAVLARRGWELYGWTPDQSDMMTDYYSPEHWEGIAQRDGVVLAVDVCSVRNSGGRTRSRQVESGTCPRCGGNGWEPDADQWPLAAARDNPEEYDSFYNRRMWGEDSNVVALLPVVSPIPFDYDPQRQGSYLKCIKCHGHGKTYRAEDYVEPWPEYQANPAHKTWHAEKDGRIIASGVGLSKARGYGAEGLANAGQLVDMIEAKIAKALQPRQPHLTSSNSGGGNGAKVASTTEATLEQDRDWLWLRFPSKPADSTLADLKAMGGRWSRKRQAWYFTDASIKGQLQQAIIH